MPNGRSNGSQVKLLKRVTLMLAAAHRESLRRFAQNEQRFAQNERLLAELRMEFLEWRDRSEKQGADLKE